MFELLNEIKETYVLHLPQSQKRSYAKEAFANGESPVSKSAKRILLTGCPSTGVIQKVRMTIENNGGVIVCLDDCSGERTQKMLVDECVKKKVFHT